MESRELSCYAIVGCLVGAAILGGAVTILVGKCFTKSANTVVPQSETIPSPCSSDAVKGVTKNVVQKISETVGETAITEGQEMLEISEGVSINQDLLQSIIENDTAEAQEALIDSFPIIESLDLQQLLSIVEVIRDGSGNGLVPLCGLFITTHMMLISSVGSANDLTFIKRNAKSILLKHAPSNLQNYLYGLDWDNKILKTQNKEASKPSRLCLDSASSKDVLRGSFSFKDGQTNRRGWSKSDSWPSSITSGRSMGSVYEED